MAGDHKCPVCQSTFTRPQHVARHMRSHTGDRPYRCQYCGDQFARSDLLSRHINKCHATEKAANQGSIGRRKGQGLDATTRAVTSKQACDDCVIQNLPCDGGNPCGKCMQRKARCTYVKFQRQTAPRGPGHRPSLSEDATAGYGRLGEMYASSAALHAPVSAGNVYDSTGVPTATNFNFQPSAPLYRTSLDPHMADSPPLDDFTARYRAQAELLQRAGNMYNSAAAASSVPGYGNGSPVLPNGMYAETASDRVPSSGASWTASLNGTNSSSGMAYASYGTSASLGDLSQSVPTSGYAGSGTSSTNSTLGRYPYNYSQVSGTNGLGYSYDNRRRSVEYHSDSGSAASHSVPSSANSSNIHLPMSDMSSHPLNGHPQSMNLDSHLPTTHPQGNMAGALQYPSVGPVATAQDLHTNGVQPVVSAPIGEGGFSSAFGLMSLDDENVLAGISSDGTPFFSTAAMNLLVAEEEAAAITARTANAHNLSLAHAGSTGTLAPEGSSALSPLARENELKELRDFWKQYMRTPLTGSTPRAETGGYILGNPIGTAGPATQGIGRPSPPKRGLSRVVSLPNVKTPKAEQQPGHVAARDRNRTMHDGEDLRSYEQAVLARKAPQLTFNPPVRRPRHSASPRTGMGVSLDDSCSSGSSGGKSPTTGTSGSGSPAMPPPPLNVTGTSSLSQAYGGNAHSAYPPNVGAIASTNPSDRMKPNPSVSDVHPGASAAEGMAAQGDDGRPAFKRLPSAQIGPIQPKRTQFDDRNGVGDVEFAGADSGVSSISGMRRLSARS